MMYIIYNINIYNNNNNTTLKHLNKNNNFINHIIIEWLWNTNINGSLQDSKIKKLYLSGSAFAENLEKLK